MTRKLATAALAALVLTGLGAAAADAAPRDSTTSAASVKSGRTWV